MQHIEVNGETCFYDGPKGLLNLIDEKMGRDTRDAVGDLIDQNKCVGECDVTYKIHEHYTRVIRDALDELRAARKPGKLGSVDSLIFSRALRQLEAEA